MKLFDLNSDSARPIRSRFRTAGKWIVGDRIGLLIFVISIAAAMLLWRHVISISDNYTIANGLVALSEGRLYVVEPTFGHSLGTPGMVHVDGRAYPRNFAHILFSLPTLWILQAISAVADLRIAIAGLWSSLILSVGLILGNLFSRPRIGRIGGGFVAIVAFGVNLWFATPLVVDHLALLALQVTTMLAAGFSAVLVYRLIKRLHDRRIGLFAGLAVGLASPGLLWASIPKRHILTAAFALTTLYLLTRSRQIPEIGKKRRYRALAYVPVGLTAWLNAAEGLVLLLALLLVDLATARENGLWTLLTIGAAFGISLIPMLITNTLVSGDPLTVPRMLPPYATQGDEVRFVGDAVWAGEGGTTGGSGEVSDPNSAGEGGPTGGSGEVSDPNSAGEGGTTGKSGEVSDPNSAGEGGTTGKSGEVSDPNSAGEGGTTGGTGEVSDPNNAGESGSGLLSFFSPLIVFLSGLAHPILRTIERGLIFFSFLRQGIDAIVTHPSKIYHTFIRSGYVGTQGTGASGLAINLAFFEALPIAGALVSIPIVVVNELRNKITIKALSQRLQSAGGTADAFVLVYSITLVLLYIPRFPLHAMLTVRYIYPLFPLAIYGLVRLQTVQRVLRDRSTILGFTYGGGVLIGGQVALLVIHVMEYGVDEAMQGFALLALGFMIGVAIWSTLGLFSSDFDRLGGVIFGSAAAVTTDLMVLIAYYYFGNGFVLPLSP